jgi:virginiamycin B lyase
MYVRAYGMSIRSMLVVFTAVVVGLVVTVAPALRAQPQLALTGAVTSAAEGPMEGVVVSAKGVGSTIMVSVISDAKGEYRFPASYLKPGNYALQTRAVGYDLAGPKAATVAAGETTTMNLRLQKTADLFDQMTNAELMYSAPGTYAEKKGLLACVDCHSLQRVFASTHTADDFLKTVLPRMENYANMSFWLHPQPYPHDRTGRGGFVTPQFAAYLASINMSSGKRPWPLRTFPRLKGRSTHVVITQYDLPRRTIEPHDVVMTPDGMVWYSDFGEQKMGELNPKTGQVTEYTVPELKKGYLTGALELDQDPSGNLWLAMMYQGGIAEFNRTTHQFKEYAISPAENPEFTQESMVMPVHSDVDGKVWTNNQDDHSVRRLDLATGTFDNWGPYTYPNSKEVVHGYGLIADNQNNVWLLDFGKSAIARVDAKTGTGKVYETPTPDSHPRRGRVDKNGILWFAEYGANQIGAYDTNVLDGTIKEYPLPTPWDSPYDVVADTTGHVWTGSMLTDRVSCLDPTTGKVVEYQLPMTTNIRRVFVDNSTTPRTLWVGSNHGAAILRVQPTN